MYLTPMGEENYIIFLYLGEVGYRIFNYTSHSLNMFFWSSWKEIKYLFVSSALFFFLIAFIIYSNKPNASPEIRKVDKACDCNVKVGAGVLKPTLTVFFYLHNLEKVINLFCAFLRGLYLESSWMTVMTFSDNNMTGFGAV